MSNIPEILRLDSVTDELIQDAVDDHLHRRRVDPNEILFRIAEHHKRRFNKKAELRVQQVKAQEERQSHHRKILDLI